MPDDLSQPPPSDPWLAGYVAAIHDVLALFDEFDIRRPSLAAPLLLGFQADVDRLRTKKRPKAA